MKRILLVLAVLVGIVAGFHFIPARFVVGDISVIPSSVEVGDSVIVSVSVTNSGLITGTHILTLKLDDYTESQKEVTLNAHETKLVTFSTAQYTEGAYSVDVNGKLGLLIVTEPSTSSTTSSTYVVTPSGKPTAL